jgi:hypothetical protein
MSFHIQHVHKKRSCQIGVLLGSSNLKSTCTCAQNMTGRGGAGKDSGGKSCRGAEHGQAGTKDSTGAEALGAALESGVQLGRGLAKRRRDQASRNGQPYEMSGFAPETVQSFREKTAEFVDRVLKAGILVYDVIVSFMGQR